MEYTTQKKILWFKRKLYGWGWTPATWQGWVTIFLYMLLLMGIFRQVDKHSHSDSDTVIGVSLPFIILSIILIGVCYIKGETPRWQWGKENHQRE